MSGNSSRETRTQRGGTVWLFKFYFITIIVVWIEGQKRGDWQVALCRADQSHSSRRQMAAGTAFLNHTQKEAPNNGGCYRGNWSRRRPSFLLLIFFPDHEPKLGFNNRPWTPTADHRDTSQSYPQPFQNTTLPSLYQCSDEWNSANETQNL